MDLGEGKKMLLNEQKYHREDAALICALFVCIVLYLALGVRFGERKSSSSWRNWRTLFPTKISVRRYW